MVEYEGGKTYEDLAAFAEENLVPFCSVDNVDLCDDETKKLMGEYQSMSNEELGSLIKAEEEKLKAAKTAYKEEIERLQKLHDVAYVAKLEAIAQVREGGMPLMKSVQKAKRKASRGSKKSEPAGEEEL